MGSYLAHVAEDGRQQTVLQHLSATAQKCTAFAQVFHAEEQGDLAGLAHDLGKYSNEFQDRLLHHGPRVDHATAGAFECLGSDSPMRRLRSPDITAGSLMAGVKRTIRIPVLFLAA